MLEKDLILRNPLELLGFETEDVLPEGGFGAVLARAGVGKTALMVQFALYTLLRRKSVLHVSLDDSVKKVSLWYEEALRNIATHYGVKQISRLRDAILKHRLIMTFKAGDFSVEKLKERLKDFKDQNIFFPHTILIDGLIFDEPVQKTLVNLKSFAKTHSIHVWFAVRTHRHKKPGPDGLPARLADISDLFEVIIQLQPEGKDVHLRALKGKSATSDHLRLLLDTSTMLIKDSG